MRPLSDDLRERLVKAYTNGEVTYRKLAEGFSVSYSACFQIIKRYRECGNVNPLPFNKGHRSKFGGAEKERLAQLIRSSPDATLDEITRMLHKELGFQVHRTTIGRILRRLNITRKKNRCSKRTGTSRCPISTGIMDPKSR